MGRAGFGAFRCFQNGFHNENASNDCTLITPALWYAIFRASAALRPAVHLMFYRKRNNDSMVGDFALKRNLIVRKCKESKLPWLRRKKRYSLVLFKFLRAPNRSSTIPTVHLNFWVSCLQKCGICAWVLYEPLASCWPAKTGWRGEYDYMEKFQPG